MTHMDAFRRHIWKFILPVAWVLLACGSFGPAPPSLSEVEILATADAIRSRTPVVTKAEEGAVGGGSYLDDLHADAIDTATSQAIDAIVATDHAWLTGEANAVRDLESDPAQRATAEHRQILIEMATDQVKQRSQIATADAIQEHRWATLEAEAQATAEFEAYIDDIVATDEALLTAEAKHGCPGGCTTFPTWCDPPIKGNVSFSTGERIYHMPGDEYYEETKINPRYGEYYFCTPQEAEAAGFRRARN